MGGSSGGQCCYPVVTYLGCPGGRPFLVEGQARTAGAGTTGRGWQSASEAELGAQLPDAARSRIALEWASDGRMEHASVAAFAKFALELMAHGAPLDLVKDTQRAMADEIRHAQRCFALAAQYGESDVVLGPLDFGVIRADASLASVLQSTILEGCVGETVAATMAAHAAILALEPKAAAALAEIAEDESRHAELAWRFVAWALAHHPELQTVARQTFAHAIAELLRSSESELEAEPFEEQLAAHGRLSGVRKRSAIQAAVSEVIRPCSLALFASPQTGLAAQAEQPSLHMV